MSSSLLWSQQVHLQSHLLAHHLPRGAVLHSTSAHFHQPLHLLGHITAFPSRAPVPQTPNTNELFWPPARKSAGTKNKPQAVLHPLPTPVEWLWVQRLKSLLFPKRKQSKTHRKERGFKAPASKLEKNPSQFHTENMIKVFLPSTKRGKT